MTHCGLENIPACDRALKGKRLGLITSVSGVDARLESGIELLHRRYGLTALFGPEHGRRGEAGAGETVDSSRDPVTGLPVYSLYGRDSRRMPPEALEHLDAVVYDMKDLGVRYYTFIATLLGAVEDCAAAGKELIVLDRPDPLGGVAVEGGVLQPQYASFVGPWQLPVRYGLTAGELAGMYNQREHKGCRLTVVPLEGWRREMLWPDTGRLFMPPSLGIPRFETALVYPGTCLVEGTNLSEGRGTSSPFEVVGAPWVDARRLTDELRRRELPGVLFTPAWFTPSASKHAGEACQGVRLHVADAHTFRPVRTGLELLDAVRTLWPEQFALLPPPKEGGRPFISLLAGCGDLQDPHWDKDALLERFERESEAFAREKTAYHLYE